MKSRTESGMIEPRMASAITSSAITVSEGLIRREAVSNALTDLRLEGLRPSPTVLDSLDLYVTGDIDESELLNRVLSR